MSGVEKIAVIAGGTGLIGRALIPLLKEEGYKVVLLSRKVSKSQVEDVQRVVWDGRTPEKIVPILEGATVVINLSGHPVSSLWIKRNRRKILESRIFSTRAIVQAISQCSKKPLVYLQASAVGFYPSHSNNVLSEFSPMGEGFLAHVTKLWEEEAKACSSVRVVLLRTGIVLSCHGGLLPKIVKPMRFFLGARLGDGSNVIPWIHIHDHVHAIKFLMENPDASGPFNLVAPAVNTQWDLLQHASKILNRKVFFKIPKVLLNFLPGNMTNELLIANQHVIPLRIIQLGFRFRFSTLPKALQNLLKN